MRGMRLTTESTLAEMAAAILGAFDGSTPEDAGVEENMQPSWGQHFPGADKIADRVLAQGKGERPAAPELSRWTNSVDCPTDAIGVTCDRMTELLGYDVQPPLKLLGGVIVTWQTIISIGNLWGSYRQAVDAGEDLRWPLAPIVRAWQQRPRPVEPSRRTTERVIPARLAMARTPSQRNARLLFSPAAHASFGPDGKPMVMPGFAKPDTPSPALPLALYDLGAGPAISPGKGAPLALRMFVESVLSVPMDERERGRPVAMSVSLRDFLAWLYPTRTSQPSGVLATPDGGHRSAGQLGRQGSPVRPIDQAQRVVPSGFRGWNSSRPRYPGRVRPNHR